MTGSTIAAGRYRINGVIGAGGMGTVYEGVHTATDRPVAIKILPDGNGNRAETAQLAARLTREARAAGAINSQHIVQVLDAGTDPDTGASFLVMELLRGRDLSQLLKALGPFPPDLALRIAAQACVGLSKAHAAGVIHRDIKPANLFLADAEGGDLVLKILDFGIAKLTVDRLQKSEGAELTRTGTMLGSPQYMSPEQARGRKDIDARSDIWSLGIVLFRMLTGQPAHRRVSGSDTLGEIILAICSRVPPSVQESAPWVSPDCARLVQRALRLDAAERFPSADAMLEATMELLPHGASIREDMLHALPDTERAVVAVTVPGLDPVTVADAALTPPARRIEPATRQASGATRWTLPLAVAALVAMGGASWLLRPLLASRSATTAPASVAAQAGGAAAATAPSVPEAAPPATYTVKLAVSPSTAAVEVDGAPTERRDGFVELRGVRGSTHRVRMWLDKREEIREVVITEDGAFPPAITLEKAPPAAGVRRVTPTSPATVATANAPASAQPATQTLHIQKTFE